MEVVKITENIFEEEVLNSDKPVLIDFNADWCGPCRMLGPIMEDFAKANEDIKVVSINVDENENLATEYGVFSIPCVILMKDGEEVKRKVGFMQKEELETFVGE